MKPSSPEDSLSIDIRTASEQVLDDPAVTRICAWLNKKHGRGQRVAWAKQDPARTDVGAPRMWPGYPWESAGTDLREEHRRGLLQVLAYANLAEKPKVICCLAYPCSLTTWESLKQGGRLFHSAELSTRTRQVTVWLTAMPMHGDAPRIAEPIAELLLGIIRDAA